MQEMPTGVNLLLIELGAESQMISAFDYHGRNTGRVHLLEVDAHIPGRERSATNNLGWFVLGLESPIVMAMLTLAKVPGGTIVVHGP